MKLLDLVYILVGIIALPFLVRKKREGWSQRCGHVGEMLKADGQRGDGPTIKRKRILLHAVSVGEVNALRTIVPLLSNLDHVIVSTTTDTGLAHAQRLFGDMDWVDVVRYPLDCSWMVKRFLNTVAPDIVCLIELEVWPNFIKICQERDVPIGIINGRLSERSFRGYRKAKLFLRNTFARLSFACVQDEAYAERIRHMGVPPESVIITGSMKWDSVDTSEDSFPDEKAIAIAGEFGIDLTMPIVVAGSTGPEEEQVLDEQIPDDVQLVMAPRKTERFDIAAQQVPHCVRRSKGETASKGESRFLLDTIGELSSLYGLADVVIIGRSFGDLFGSDPVEPAAMGKPVLIGPRYGDFQHAVDVLLKGDAIKVVDRDTVGVAVTELLSHEQARRAMGDRARACVRSQQGASKQHVDQIMTCLGEWDWSRRSV